MQPLHKAQRGKPRQAATRLHGEEGCGCKAKCKHRDYCFAASQAIGGHAIQSIRHRAAAATNPRPWPNAPRSRRWPRPVSVKREVAWRLHDHAVGPDGPCPKPTGDRPPAMRPCETGRFTMRNRPSCNARRPVLPYGMALAANSLGLSHLGRHRQRGGRRAQTIALKQRARLPNPPHWPSLPGHQK